MDLKVKRKQDPCQPPPRGVDSCRQLRWWDVMWHFPASPQPEFTFLSPGIIFISWKNTPLAIVLPCDTQAAEQSLCHTVSSHCPLSCLPVALGSQLPWRILGLQLLLTFPPSQLRVLALTPSAGVLTHLCHLLCFSSPALALGQGLLLLCFTEGPSSPSSSLALRAASSQSYFSPCRSPLALLTIPWYSSWGQPPASQPAPAAACRELPTSDLV